MGRQSIAFVFIGISLLALFSILTPKLAEAQTGVSGVQTNSTSAVLVNATSTGSSASTASSTPLLPTSTTNSSATNTIQVYSTSTSSSSISSETGTASSVSTTLSSSTIETNSSTTVVSSVEQYTSTIVASDNTTTTVTSWQTASSENYPDYGAYSISFSPSYWLCNPVSVTFTGPLVESGYYGDTLQFQYFQYNPTYPSVLTPIFTDPSLTVTSDTVSYWIGAGEYAGVNFAYQPNIAVKVVDLSPKSNGYPPGLIYFDLTNISPEGLNYCPYPYPAPYPSPEFQFQWLVIIASIVLSLAVLRVRKRQHD